MKKILSAVIFTSVLAINTTAMAADSREICGGEGKLCFSSEDIIKEVVKETVTVVGQHLLEKYIKGDGIKELKNSFKKEQSDNNASNSNTQTTTTSTQAIIVECSEPTEPQTVTQNASSQSTSGDSDLIILD